MPAVDDPSVVAPESRALVEDADRARSLALPFLPADKRDAICSLYAFDIEISRIRELVSEPIPGEIRLQWWRDILSSGAKSGSGHPVADELLATIDRHDLPRTAFDRFVEARIFDLYHDPFPSSGDLEAYAGETRSTLIMLAAMVLSRDDAERIGDAAGHAGVAQTVAGFLASLPSSRARKHCPIPLDLLAAVGSKPEDFIAGGEDVSARAIPAFAAYGREHDRRWREHFARVPASVRGAFLPVASAGLVFDKAETNAAAALRQPIETSPLRTTWRMWRTMRG